MMYSRDNKIMRKLLGKTAADSNTTDASPGLGITSAPQLQASHRPTASQNALYPAGVPILCLDASPDRRAAVLAGRHVLKTVNFDGLTITDGVDIRSAITSQTASNKITTAGSSAADQLSIKDVKWHGDSTIFTACANGKIFSYDLSRIGPGGSPVELVQTREDTRQVNTLDINPHRKTYLLSGSQDGFVRCFDIRQPVQGRTAALTYQVRASYKCNADGVRQVQWSPKDGFFFACGTESGVVLKWDMRKASSPLLRIPAHEKACSSISWHPDGNHLISGGWDSKCAVWDMSRTADKRQKAKWTIYTPAPVSVVTWRPGLWSASAGSRRAAQVAVSYDDSSHKRYGINAVHIWDLARPTMPFKEIVRFHSSPTALMWQDQDTLWTAGQDGFFNQCDVAFAPRVLDRQSLSSIAFSARGDVAMFLDERPRDRPRPSALQHHQPDVINRSSYSSSPTTPMLSVSRSDSEDDVVGSFLGPRRRVSRKRRSSLRSVAPLSTTPPSAPGLGEDQILGLEQAMKLTGTFKTQQTMAVGHVPSAAKVGVYQYLAGQYLETLERGLPSATGTIPMVDRVGSILEHYARAAENVSQFRLAQTWRILGYAMSLLLKRRAQFHLETRLGYFRKKSPPPKAKESARQREPRILGIVVEENDEEAQSRPSASNIDSRSLTVRSLLSEEIESTSNVATPLARPVDDDTEAHHDYRPGRKLAPMMDSDNFALPPSVHPTFSNSPRRRLDSVMSHQSDQTQISSTDGYDFYDTDVLAQAIDVPGARRPPVPLEYGPRKVLRHDSDESFAQMFSMSESSRQVTLSSDGDGSSRSRRTEQEEYESRIRGREIKASPEQPRLLSLSRLPPTDSPEEIFMISQTTMATDSSQSPTVALEGDANALLHVGVDASSPSSPHPSRQYDVSPVILETDYLPWHDDPPYPHPLSTTSSSSTPPLDPYTLLIRALDFETRTSALHASAMVLLLEPLMPEGLIDSLRATAILRQHHARLMGMKLFIEAALLRKLCVRGWPAGFPDWGDNYTSIFSPAQQSVKGGFLCPSCRKPRELDPSEGTKGLWECERCHAIMAPCAVCGHRETTATLLPTEDSSAHHDEPVLSTWWYCPGCAHGGHATCLQGWHASTDETESSGGCCPLDGCGHACLPGKWREEKGTARSEEVSRAEKTRRKESPILGDNVRGDSVEVPQSRAVESVREALAGSVTGSILSASPGRSGDRERRKSVKFVPTER